MSKDVLERLYRDKLNAKSSDFLNEKKEKTTGVNAGYVGTREIDQSTHMIKSVSKSYVKTEEDGLYFAPKQRREYNKQTGEYSEISAKRMANENRNDFLREYLASGLYQRILFDRAPKINLVTDQDNPRVIALNSKFLNDFTLYSEFNDFTNLPKGFEKIIAASLSLGDVDFHSKNVGVVAPEEGNKFARIDYGRALCTFYQNPEELILISSKMFREFGYSRDERIKFGVKDFREAIDEIVKISDAEIDNMIDAKIHQLKQIEFEPDKSIAYYDAGEVQRFDLKDNKYGELAQFYKQKLKNQFQTMRAVSKLLTVVEKIDTKDPKWKDKQWLEDVGYVGGDPFRYALHENLTIAGKHPIVWAIENNYKIESKDPIVWAINNKIKFDIEENGIKDKVEGIEWAVKNNYKIEAMNPIIYARKNKIKIDGRDSLEWAIRNNVKIRNKDPLVWALTYSKKIDGKNPLEWAKQNRRQIYDEKSKKNINVEEWYKRNIQTIDGVPLYEWAKKNKLDLTPKSSFSESPTKENYNPNIRIKKEEMAH